MLTQMKPSISFFFYPEENALVTSLIAPCTNRSRCGITPPPHVEESNHVTPRKIPRYLPVIVGECVGLLDSLLSQNVEGVGSLWGCNAVRLVSDIEAWGHLGEVSDRLRRALAPMTDR